MALKLKRRQKGLEPYISCMNDDPGLTLTYSMARSNVFPSAFEWEKCKTAHSSKTIDVYEIGLT